MKKKKKKKKKVLEAEPVPGEPEIRRGGNYEFNVPHRPLSMDWKTSPPSLSRPLIKPVTPISNLKGLKRFREIATSCNEM